MFCCQPPFDEVNESVVTSSHLETMFSNDIRVMSTYIEYMQISTHHCLLKYHGLSMKMVKFGSRMLMMNCALILMQLLSKTISNKMGKYPGISIMHLLQPTEGCIGHWCNKSADIFTYPGIAEFHILFSASLGGLTFNSELWRKICLVLILVTSKFSFLHTCL